MDRKIEKKYWTKKRIAYIIGGLIIGVLSVYAITNLNKKTFNLDHSRITVKVVKESEFQDIILIEAEVQPITTILVNNPEGGTVQEVFVEDGEMIKKGTSLLKLNNPGVMLAYMTQETAIMEQINNLRSLKLSLDRDQRTLSESLIDVEYQLTDKKRLYQVDSQLYHESVIAKTQYDDINGQLNYQQKKHAFLVENVAKTKEDNSLQIKRINRSINMMERNLHVIHDNVDRMTVRAPIDGRISSFDPVIGESYANNQTIAKIDVLAGYKIIGKVDEYYLSTAKVGQSARFSLGGQIIELKVRKVLPEVNNGRFEIELDFMDQAPESIAIGQSVQVRLELSESKQALIIPRGPFFHSFGGKYVFVLNETGGADKRQIRIGRQNPSSYEVLDGLMKGEQIITSSYETFKDFESITISN